MLLTQLALCVLSECLQIPSNVPFYMKTDCDKIVQCFINSTDSDIRIYSVIILSYLTSKLLVSQRHQLRFTSNDVLTVLDELSSSLSADRFSSSISLLRDLQSVVLADQKNAEAFISHGILSTISKPLASFDSSVQKEAILLVWKLASIPIFTEKVKHHADLIQSLQGLQGSSNPNIALASSCLLWDITGERNTSKFHGILIIDITNRYPKKSSKLNPLLLAAQWVWFSRKRERVYSTICKIPK